MRNGLKTAVLGVSDAVVGCSPVCCSDALPVRSLDLLTDAPQRSAEHATLATCCEAVAMQMRRAPQTSVRLWSPVRVRLCALGRADLCRADAPVRGQHAADLGRWVWADLMRPETFFKNF